MGTLQTLCYFLPFILQCSVPDDTKPRVNLLTQRVLAIFPALEYVKVDDYYGEYQFSLSLFINETLRRLQSVKNGNFQCEVCEEWVAKEYETLSGDLTPFVVEVMQDEYGDQFLRIQCI